MRSDNLLMVAESEHDANMLYAVGMFVPEPFIYLLYYLETGGVCLEDLALITCNGPRNLTKFEKVLEI